MNDPIREGDIVSFEWIGGNVIWLALEDEQRHVVRCLILPPVASGKEIRIADCHPKGFDDTIELLLRRPT